MGSDPGDYADRFYEDEESSAGEGDVANPRLRRRIHRDGMAVAEVCRLHDAWIGALIEQAGPGASVFVVSERGLDLGFWRHPPGTVTARPSAMVPPGIIAMRVPGGPRDAMAFGIRSNQVAGLVLDTLGVALPAAGAARPLGDCGNLSHSDGRHASLAALRYSVFAAAAAACGDAAAARELQNQQVVLVGDSV
jgi:hypothetical protein